MIVIYGALLTGLIATYLNRKELLLAWKSCKWPSIEGRVSAKRFRYGSSLGIASDGTYEPTVRRWRDVEVFFSYRINEVTYTSSIPDFSGFGWGYERYYKEGGRVTVCYYLGCPSIAVAHPGTRLSVIRGPVVILLSAFIILYFR